MPKHNSIGGKERLGHISIAGTRYLRNCLLVIGALSVIRRAKRQDTMTNSLTLEAGLQCLDIRIRSSSS